MLKYYTPRGLDGLDGDTEADIELAGNRVGSVLSGAEHCWLRWVWVQGGV